ncbi:MAG: hypothetical protein HZC14_00565 [Candidatus Niyogibacteria bacterium]|nr:hypothetical protein [Candidatus Niyogibacteria bacterium]
MIFFSILAVLSFVGVVAIILRNLSLVRSLTEEELARAMAERFSVREELLSRLLVPACDRAHDYCVPKFYAFSEKTLRRFRILVLKTENKLQKVADYLKGKRNLNGDSGNGSVKNSDYWREINEHQNNVKNGLPTGQAGSAVENS